MTDFDKVIPPGSEGKVSATVDIAHSKGPIQKQIQLETDDPGQPQTTLYIKAVVKTEIDIQPSEQITFRINKGQPANQVLTITPAAGKAIKLHDPVVNSDFFDVKLEPKENAYTLNVSLKPNAPVGTQQATIKIAEDGSAEKELTIPVFALVRGPISVAPPAVSFDIRNFPESVTPRNAAHVRQEPGLNSAAVDKVETGASLRVISQNVKWYQVITPANKAGWVSKTSVKTMKMSPRPDPVMVALQNTNGGDFKVLDYSANLAQIKVEKVDDTGKSYTFRISLTSFNKAKAANAMGVITVKTDQPEQALIKIPVYINVS